jgi:hypothetical protein
LAKQGRPSFGLVKPQKRGRPKCGRRSV